MTEKPLSTSQPTGESVSETMTEAPVTVPALTVNTIVTKVLEELQKQQQPGPSGSISGSSG